MANQRLASRYAKAMLGLATEQNVVDAVYVSVKELEENLSSSNDFKAFFRNPVIDKSKKIAVFDAIDNGRFHKVLSGFIHLLISRGRESFVHEILLEFEQQVLKLKGIVKAHITSAAPLNESTIKTLEEKIKAMGGAEVVTTHEVDKSLLGGFTVRIDDKLLDNSVKRKLSLLQNEFLTDDYVEIIDA